METKILAIGTMIVILSGALLYKLGTNWIDNVSSDLKKALAKMLEVDALGARVNLVESNLKSHIDRSDSRFDKLEQLNSDQIRLLKKNYRLLRSVYGRRTSDKEDKT